LWGYVTKNCEDMWHVTKKCEDIRHYMWRRIVMEYYEDMCHISWYVSHILTIFFQAFRTSRVSSFRLSVQVLQAFLQACPSHWKAVYRVAKAHRMPFFAKEPLIIGLFCGKWPIKIRHPMTLRHPVGKACPQNSFSFPRTPFPEPRSSRTHTGPHGGGRASTRSCSAPLYDWTALRYRCFL